MSVSKTEKSNKEIWGCIGAITAAVIAGIVALIINAPTLVPFFFGTPIPTPLTINTDSIAGNWAGTSNSENGDFSTQIDLSIQAGCTIGNVCGTYSAPQLPCSGSLFLTAIDGDTYEFVEHFSDGADLCDSGGHEYI